MISKSNASSAPSGPGNVDVLTRARGRTGKGKLTTSERLGHLVDPRTLDELNPYVTPRHTAFGVDERPFPGDRAMASRFVISLVVSGFPMLMRFLAVRLLGRLMYGMMMRIKAHPQERGQSSSIRQDRGSRGAVGKRGRKRLS